MNISAISRKLLGIRARPSSPPPAIELLEARIAPASLVSPTTVTFQDKNGDAVTVTISKHLFTTASVAKVFTFDSAFATGSTGGVNSVPQQLEMLNITKLGHARGLDITITAVPVSGSADLSVGYINASGIPLGDVTIGGDLGRIAAGNVAVSGQALHSLTVDSLGAQPVATTQLPGGNLTSLISGGVGSITVNGDIDGASIGIGGGAKGTLGTLTGVSPALLVTGSIYGGSADFSGSIRTQGGITSVQVDGSVIGGAGMDSGAIGTAGALGAVLVEGSVTGGPGPGIFSGAILSTKAMQSVVIDGNLTGGAGVESGQVGTASNLGAVTIGGSVTGGLGSFSGDILATGNITTVTISTDLVGGGGTDSGEIGSGASIGTVTIDGSMSAGAQIHAYQNIQTVSVNAISNALVTAGGNIGAIQAGSTLVLDSEEAFFSIVNSGFNAGGNIGSVNATAGIDGSVFVAGIDLGASFNVTGAGTFGTGSFGFGSSTSALAASIGPITAGGLIAQSTFLAGVHGAGADGMFGTTDDSVPPGSSIGAISAPGGLNTDFFESGNIGATTSGAIVDTMYLSTDTAVSAGGIGPITVLADIPALNGDVVGLGPLISTDASHGIYSSTFTSNAGIGAVSVTLNGFRMNGENAGISSSTFQAGHALGAITVTDNAYGSGGFNYGIVSSTFYGGLDGYGGTGDITVTLTDAGPDGNTAAIAGTLFDPSVCACMSANMGSISAENADTASNAAGILDSIFRVHGNIGNISATMDSGSPTAGAIEGTIFSAFGSIGDINVFGAVLPDPTPSFLQTYGIGPSRFLAGYDIGSTMMFGGQDLSATSLALQAGQSVGNVAVTGYFEGSDIIASINPGPDYTFGDGTNTNVGAGGLGAGGSIGIVNIGTAVSLDGSPFVADHNTSHAIEAANFAPGDTTVPALTAFGVPGDIPVVLYVDGGSGDVRITNLTLADDGD